MENLEHVLTGCAGRRKDYIDRHDSVGKRIYEALCKKYEIALCYQSDPVTIETKRVKIHWNQRMVKGKDSQPDITVYDYKEKNVLIFDVSIVNKKYLEERFKTKNKKYSELALNLKEMSGLKYSMVIPVIVSVEGLIHKKSVELLDQAGIKINWGKSITNILFFNVNLINKIYVEHESWRERKRKQLEE